MERDKGSITLANFERFGLERHVTLALRSALTLTNGRPISAANALISACIVGNSRAFAHIATLLPNAVPDNPPKNLRTGNLAAVPMSTQLARSFKLAEPFLLQQPTVWGRDFVTMAVLASDDPSLAELARASSQAVAGLQDQWFRFIQSDARHRSPDTWRYWWLRAGVPLPEDRNVPTYLFTWDPFKKPWSELADFAAGISGAGAATMGWSIGTRSDAQVGARVFLLRQDERDPGLVGSGVVTGLPQTDQHWQQSKAASGQTYQFVDVLWDTLTEHPLLTKDRLLSELGSDLWETPEGGREIPPDVSESLESLWRSVRAGEVVRDTEELGFSRLIPRFSADTVGGRDDLHVQPYVDAFSRVIASKNLTPPLSIGLFGDWGSGKTHFMELMHDKISELSSQANHEGASPYWPYICQIRFNAWHYAEVNLWASLVNAIFDRLRAYCDKDVDDADDFNKLLNRLEVARHLREQEQQRLEAAQDAYRIALEAVTDAKSKLDNLPPPPEPSPDEYQKVLKEVVFRKPKELSTFKQLLADAGDVLGREDLKQWADQTEPTVEDARKLLAQTRALSSRADFWWRTLIAANLHKNPKFWLVVALLIAIPVVGGILGSRLEDQWNSMLTALTEISAAAAAVVAWARARLAKSAKLLDWADQLRHDIEERIDDARSKDESRYAAALEEAKQVAEAAREALSRAQEDWELARDEQAEAERALRTSTSQARLANFIRERAGASDYSKYLGLIAMVHRDFERLSTLMRRQEGEERDPELPTVNRIVLYIDDLDRCPPKEVVRVLEAVHLLLFFPLFVVVVGVDSRWVSRALYKHYGEMLADETISETEDGTALERAPANSHDYLEKIFQIPFWLRRMDPGAVQLMIHGLITDEEVATSERPTEPPVNGRINVAEGSTDPAGATGTPEPPDREHISKSERKHVVAEAEINEELLADDTPDTWPTEALTITEAELAYMEAVAPIMPRTPRSVKRFVNIYRLYKATLSAPALRRFLGTRTTPGNFRSVQVLLALVTGSPDFARAVFDQLHATPPGEDPAPEQRLSKLVETITAPDQPAEVTLSALRDFAKGPNDLLLSDLQLVAALVGRYSVHHMVSDAPGEVQLG